MSNKNNTTINVSDLTTLRDNVKNAYDRALSMVKTLNDTATTVENNAISLSSAKMDLAISGAKSAISELNALTALLYHREHSVSATIEAGACVPAYALTTENDLFVMTSVKVYPTLTSLVEAGSISKDIALAANVLRFVAALLVMGDTQANRDAILSHASKKVAAILPETVSNTTAKKVFDEVMVTLTGKHGSASMWQDFKALSVKRTGEWGKRQIANQAHVGDLILEYAHLTMNGKRLEVEAKASK